MTASKRNRKQLKVLRLPNLSAERLIRGVVVRDIFLPTKMSRGWCNPPPWFDLASMTPGRAVVGKGEPD